MQLLNIQEYLEVYRKKLSDADEEKNSIIETIKQISGVELEHRHVILKKGILSIQTDSITKNQLYLYKDKLIDAFKKSAGNKVFDIR